MKIEADTTHEQALDSINGIVRCTWFFFFFFCEGVGFLGSVGISALVHSQVVDNITIMTSIELYSSSRPTFV